MDFLAYPQFTPEVAGYYMLVTKTPEDVYAVEYARYDLAGTWYKADEVAVNFESGKIVVAFVPTPEVPEYAKI